MKKIILSFAAFAALVSCTKENMPDNSQSAESVSITLQATAPGTSDDTKTTLVDHSLVHWTKGDAIKVGFPVSSAVTSTVLDKSGVFTSTFTDETSASALFSIQNWDWVYSRNDYTGTIRDDANAYTAKGIAMYPSEAYFNSVRTGSQGTIYNTQINYTLPANQIAVENSFAEELCFSTAEVNKTDFISNTSQLSFKNECALIKVVLPEAVNDVVSVNVTSISGTPLAGKFYYSNTTGQPEFPITFTITDGVELVDLNAPENEALVAGGTYYIVTCPGTHSSGLAFVFTNAEGKTCRKIVSSEVVLEKSKIDEFKFKTIAYEEAIDYTKAQVGDYFYSDGSFSTELDGTKELVGVVFYKGDQHMTDDKTLAASEYKHCNHGLVVASTAAGSGNFASNIWNSFSDWGVSNGLMSSKGYSYSGPTRLDNAKLMTGYNNTRALIGCDNANSSLTSNAVNIINNKNTNATVKGVSCWYYPSIAEFDILMTSKTELRNAIDLVNDKLLGAGKDKITGKYWTVSEENTSKCYAAIYDTTNLGSIEDGHGVSATSAYLPIFAF